ncbi:hypothetical protein BH11MYX2_BH11MYX2_41440 [soil metagenome]
MPEPKMRTSPTEAWLLVGQLDGRASLPAPMDMLGGVSHLMRLACEASMAGCTRVIVVSSDAIDLAAVQSDPRFKNATLTLARTAPTGGPEDAILVIRGDRVFHRDMPKAVIRAWNESTADVAKIIGAEHDAVLVTDRTLASRLHAVAPEPHGIQEELARHETATAAVPYFGFTAKPTTPAEVRTAERTLIWSLRKSADGMVAKLINRRISHPITYLLRNTPISPNHVTAVALLCAIVGGIVISRGSYLAGAIGMFLVNFGSIVDGVDGEIARLRYQFSQSGQWFDTIADDVATVAYTTGCMISLRASGAAWVMPLWAVATSCFLLTQGTQYFLIRVVYKSGDLAAIPWAFQSSAFLSQQPTGFWPRLRANIPKMLKRDFAVAMFTLAAFLGFLEVPLLGFSTGAIIFFGVFVTQFARNFRTLPRRRALGADIHTT